MLFKIVCILLLVVILIAAILILTILVRNLIRDFKRDVLIEVKNGLVPILEKLDGMNDQGSAPVLEMLDDIKHNGLMPMGDMLHEIRETLMWGPHPPVGSSFMMGASMSADSGHSIHVFRNGGWELQEDFSKSGYEANRPSMKGSYEGQVVRTTSSFAPEDGS